jgi:hypothetical protein
VIIKVINTEEFIMSLEHFIITVYCWVDESLGVVTKGQCLRLRGFAPGLSDAEVIMMEVVGEFLGIDTDSGIWRYFHEHWLTWFPRLGSRANFAKQAAHLWWIKQQLQEHSAKALGAVGDSLHMADGFPIPLCHFKCAGFSRLFEGDAAYGYCASEDEKYYGFKGNIMITSQGVISAMTVTPANIDERESLWELTQGIKGLLLADKGLIGHAFHQALQEQTGVNLQTPSRCNMQDDRGKDANRWLTSTRRLVETVIGQLAERFHIQKVRARDLWHLTSRMARKILAHTLAVWVNVKQGNKPLQFECLGLDLS